MARYGICSLFGNPIHSGHIDYLEGAKAQCDRLITIVNNDKQVMLKGSKPFMDERHRARIVRALKVVDEAVISFDTDDSVALTLSMIVNLIKEERTSIWIREHTFAFFNSGDRNPRTYNKQEYDVCQSLGIETVFLPMEKTHSSSGLKKNL
jgi:cytidyltransferase-like protein